MLDEVTEVGATLLMGLRGGTTKLPAAKDFALFVSVTDSELSAALLLALAAVATPVATDLLAVPKGMLCTVSCCVFFSSSVSLVTDISDFFSKSDFSLCGI